VAATPHGWLPGRTIEKSGHQDKVQAQRIIAAAKAQATLTVTDTIDSLASNVGAQVKGPRPGPVCRLTMAAMSSADTPCRCRWSWVGARSELRRWERLGGPRRGERGTWRGPRPAACGATAIDAGTSPEGSPGGGAYVCPYHYQEQVNESRHQRAVGHR
jgi:hypothetical protein